VTDATEVPSEEVEEEDFSPTTVATRDELEPFSDTFAQHDRRWRGFNLTLQRMLARATKLMEKKISGSSMSREKAGEKFARMLLLNRATATGDNKSEAVFNNTKVVFYDGDKGQFSILDNELLARTLIAHGHGDLVTIASVVVYEVSNAKVKKLAKEDSVLRAALVASGAATYVESKTITISTLLAAGEKKRGVKPSDYTYKVQDD
jgi:hypothetical protein